MTFGAILLAAIGLTGVWADDLRVRAYFDANNVKVGDPMTLTLDFLSEADLSELHPPVLAKAVGGKIWKIDQASAKTDTHDNLRRITYRVRPLKAGVIRFPPLEFKCGEQVFSSNEIPVHAKPGDGVAIELAAEEDAMPPIPEADGAEGSADEWFEIRRNLHTGEYAAAAEKLNAMAWKYGQTPSIETAMIAARARLFGNPYEELPAWRVVARPLLKHPLPRQLEILGLWMLTAVIVMLALGKTIKHFAAVALITLALSKPDITVGEPFDFLLSIEPQTKGEIGIARIVPSERYALTFTGNLEQAGERLFRIPARYEAPVDVKSLRFKVSGMITERTEIVRAGFHMTSSSSSSFTEETNPLNVKVRPLDPASQPADFSGVIAEGLRLMELPDILNVETNDVITVTYRMGSAKPVFVPRGYVPPFAAYNWSDLEWKGYVVADGIPKTPSVECCYYNPVTQTYERAKTGGTEIKYHE